MPVQFVNNWIQKIPLTAKIGRGLMALSNFGSPRNFSHPIIYKLLCAVQFGNNWMRKIPRTAKIGRGR